MNHMNLKSAFSLRNSTERLLSAKQRLEAVCCSLGNMADDFLQYESLKGAPWDEILQAHEKLPEALLARALAREGLELIEQVRWETYICKHRPEASQNPDQLSALNALTESVESEAPFLERTREQMNALIEAIMGAEKRLTDIAGALESGLKPKINPQ